MKTRVFSCKMKEKYKLFLYICARVCEMGEKRHVWERAVFAPARDSQASTKESSHRAVQFALAELRQAPQRAFLHRPELSTNTHVDRSGGRALPRHRHEQGEVRRDALARSFRSARGLLADFVGRDARGELLGSLRGHEVDERVALVPAGRFVRAALLPIVQRQVHVGDVAGTQSVQGLQELRE